LASNDQFVLEILQDVGLIDKEQATKAEFMSGGTGKGLVDTLVEMGAVTRGDVTRALANQFGMDTIDLEEVRVEQEVIDMIPANIAKRYRVLPVFLQEDNLTVAIGDPEDVETLDMLRYMLKYEISGVVADQRQLDSAIEYYYGGNEELEGVMEDLTEENVELPGLGGDMPREEDGDAPIIKLAGLIISEAFRNRTSDIHLEPLERRFRVRYRIDGVLHEVENPPKRLQSAVIARFKLMARMDLAEHRIPQDGRIQFDVAGRSLDLRVSCLPTSHGESIVMRILDKTSLLLGLPDLGFMEDDLVMFEKLISAPDGILLVTGPTGSGKTTTLYGVLNYVNRPDRKIITVEDPVEYMLAGINQVLVRDDVGLTFARALRAILRQAPNIILIGEIRDLETANIAVNASLTGHLVFSTLHTNDAPSAIPRLIDMGVKPFLVASSLRGIMAQRLVRTICKNCAEPYTPQESEYRAFGLTTEDILSASTKKGRGCHECKGSGYRGRKGIFEIFEIDEDARRLVYQLTAAAKLRHHAREHGMSTLREDGIRKALAGWTTFAEVSRVTQSDVS
jgi:general secretion pathway protein E/type IV pilus assembly protein PilB